MARKPKADPVPASPEAVDLFAANAERIEQTIMDATLGIRVAMKVAKARLLRGESELEVEDADGQTWFVYVMAPNTQLLKFVAEQVRGRAAQKEQAAGAATLLVKLALPGHDHEVDAYIQSLPPEKRDKLAL